MAKSKAKKLYRHVVWNHKHSLTRLLLSLLDAVLCLRESGHILNVVAVLQMVQQCLCQVGSFFLMVMRTSVEPTAWKEYNSEVEVALQPSAAFALGRGSAGSTCPLEELIAVIERASDWQQLQTSCVAMFDRQRTTMSSEQRTELQTRWVTAMQSESVTMCFNIGYAVPAQLLIKAFLSIRPGSEDSRLWQSLAAPVALSLPMLPCELAIVTFTMSMMQLDAAATEAHRLSVTALLQLNLCVTELGGAELQVHGSRAIFLASPTSDLDVSVCSMEKPASAFLLELADRLAERCAITEHTLRPTGAGPVLTFHVANERSRLSVDVGCRTSSHKGAALVGLVRSIATEQMILAVPLILLLKALLQRNSLNRMFTGGLPSFALTMMVINFVRAREAGGHLPPGTPLGLLLIEFCDMYGTPHAEPMIRLPGERSMSVWTLCRQWLRVTQLLAEAASSLRSGGADSDVLTRFLATRPPEMQQHLGPRP